MGLVSVAEKSCGTIERIGTPDMDDYIAAKQTVTGMTRTRLQCSAEGAHRLPTGRRARWARRAGPHLVPSYDPPAMSTTLRRPRTGTETRGADQTRSRAACNPSASVTLRRGRGALPPDRHESKATKRSKDLCPATQPVDHSIGAAGNGNEEARARGRIVRTQSRGSEGRLRQRTTQGAAERGTRRHWRRVVVRARVGPWRRQAAVFNSGEHCDRLGAIRRLGRIVHLPKWVMATRYPGTRPDEQAHRATRKVPR